MLVPFQGAAARCPWSYVLWSLGAGAAAGRRGVRACAHWSLRSGAAAGCRCQMSMAEEPDAAAFLFYLGLSWHN